MMVSICPVCGGPTGYADAQGNVPTGMPGSAQGGGIPQEQIPESERPTVLIRPNAQGQPTGMRGGTPIGQPTGMQGGTPTGQPTGMQGGMPTGQPAGIQGGTPTNQPTGMPTNQPTGGNGTFGRIPTTERPTTRVTVGDTGDLASPGTKPGSIPEGPDRNRAEKKKFKVKNKPKNLALKLSLLGVLLVGIVLGSVFAIRAMMNKRKDTPFFKMFLNKDVGMTGRALYVKNQLLIHGTKDATESKIKKLVKEKNGSVVGSIPISRDYQIEFPDVTSKDQLDRIIDEWNGNDLVASVKLHYVFGSHGGFFYEDNPWKDDNNEDEPYGSDLEWNIYQPDGNNWAVESVWAPKIWQDIEDRQSSGAASEYSGVNVGILDSTIDPTHKDLTDKFVPFKTWNEDGEEVTSSHTVEGDPTDASGQISVKDDYAPYTGRYGSKDMSDTEKIEEKRLSHGTHIAGIIGANLQDSFGIAGVAQNANLYGYASTPNESYEGGKALTSIFAYKYALTIMKENGVRLINVSMDLDPLFEDVDSEEGKQEQADMIARMNKEMEEFFLDCLEVDEEGEEPWDFLIIKSAGNKGATDLKKNFLSGIENETVRDRIVVVGGAKCVYEGSKLTGYTKTKTTNYGERVDIFAPGHDVLSDIPGDRTEKRSGTSEATAFVTGGCSLVMGILPDISMLDVKQIVLDNCYYTVRTKVDDATIERGYLNLYMAVEAARAKRDSGDLSGIRDKMQKEIEENQPKGGIVELALSKELLAEIDEPTAVAVKASCEGKDDVTGKLDANGSITLTLEEGTWTITASMDGFEPFEVKDVVVEAGKTVEKIEIVLSAEVEEINFDDLPEKEMFNWLFGTYYLGYDMKSIEETPDNAFINNNRDRIFDTSGVRGYYVDGETIEYKFPNADIIKGNPRQIETLVEFNSQEKKVADGWGVKIEGIEWMEKNIFNMSDKAIENANNIFGEEGLTRDYNGAGYYEYEGYYYRVEQLQTREGWNGGMIVAKRDSIKIRKSGKYYYVTFDLVNERDSDFSDNPEILGSMKAKLELKTVDGITFWSVYECLDYEEEETVEPKEANTGNPLKDAKVGDIVTFGSYEQDNSSDNGKEPIEWRVLDKGEDGSLLLISKYALEGSTDQLLKNSRNWSKSAMREWANSTFLSEAFSADEQKLIQETVLEKTTDKVFMLSKDEALKYFNGNDDRKCEVTSYLAENYWKPWWWLRTERSSSDTDADAEYVDDEGGFERGLEDYVMASIRPCIRILP